MAIEELPPPKSKKKTRKRTAPRTPLEKPARNRLTDAPVLESEAPAGITAAQRRVSWVTSVMGFIVAGISATAQWIQGIPLWVVLLVLVLSVFAVVVVKVNVIEAWSAPHRDALRVRANVTLVIVGVVVAAVVAVLVVVDPPEIGGWSFAFAGGWMVVTAFAITAAKSWSSSAPARDRGREVAFRAGIAVIGMTLIAVAGGGAGLIVRELMRDSVPLATFFAIQTAMIGALAFLVLQSRRRGTGVGMIAVGLALSGTAADTLWHQDPGFGWSFLVLSVTAVWSGVATLARSGYWLGFALAGMGGATVSLGLAARANGVLPFALIYIVAGAAAVLVGLLAVIWPDAVRWRASRQIETLPAVLAITASAAVALVSVSLATFWFTQGWSGLGLSFTGFAAAAAALGAGAVWALRS